MRCTTVTWLDSILFARREGCDKPACGFRIQSTFRGTFRGERLLHSHASVDASDKNCPRCNLISRV